MRIASTVHDIGELWFSLSEKCSAVLQMPSPALESYERPCVGFLR
jgi:hypothetical protein